MRISKLVRISAFTLLGLLVGGSLLLLVQNPGIHHHDAYAHLGWMKEFHAAQQAGDFYPRWLPDSYFGFGSSAFFYYPPLVYFCSSALQYLLPNLGENRLYFLLQFLFSIASAGTMYLLLTRLRAGRKSHEIYSSARSIRLLLAGLYAFGLYRFVDALLRNALSEHAAFIWLPLLFLGIEKLFHDRRSKKGILLIWLAGSALILTNLPATIIAVYGVIIFLIVRRSEFSLELLRNLAIASLLILLTTAAYWLPMAEQLGALRQQEYFHVLQGQSQWAFALLEVLKTPETFWIALVVEIVWGCVVLCALRVPHDLTPYRWMLVTALFFQIPMLAVPFLTYLPLVVWVQFSFRWLMLGALAAPMLLITAASYKQTRLLVGVVIIFCLLLGYLVHMLEPRFAHSANSCDLSNTGKFPSEYLPNTVQVTPFQGLWTMSLADGEGIVVKPRELEITSQRIAPREIRLITQLDSTTDLLLHLAAFPAWRAEANGIKLPIRADRFGIAHITAPTGRSAITLTLPRSRGEVFSLWLSGIMLLAMAGCGVYAKRKRPNHH